MNHNQGRLLVYDSRFFMQDKSKVIIYYDDRCGFCSWGADWLRRADRRQRLEFRPLIPFIDDLPDKDIEAVWLYKSGQWYKASSAVIKGLIEAGFPYSLAGVFLVIPTRMRDAVYNFIAQNRYRFPCSKGVSCNKGV